MLLTIKEGVNYFKLLNCSDVAIVAIKYFILALRGKVY
jgi:hypothetical protein